MKAENRRVLITGGAGFVGSHIADRLTDEGFEVVLFDRVESPWRRANQQMVVGDVLDGDLLRSSAAGCRYFYHLAAIADLDSANDNPVGAAEVNFVGTVKALEAARMAGVERFLFASTVYVYSRAGGFYRCSKQAGELYIEEYQRQFGLPFTILRFGSLYGPRADRGNGVFRLLEQAITNGRIQHRGTPEDSREYLHIEDAARLSVEVLAADFENQNIILTGARSMRLRDLFTMFSEILGREIEIEYQTPAVASLDTHYRVTPYAYTPRPGRKLAAQSSVDMGQGILRLVEALDRGLAESR